MHMIPCVSSNLWAARIRPRLPSLIRSESDTPWFWYFLATDTTKRRFERTSLSSASSSPCLIRCASVTSSSRVMSGYWLITREEEVTLAQRIKQGERSEEHTSELQSR